jgi:hypothetical protein
MVEASIPPNGAAGPARAQRSDVRETVCVATVGSSAESVQNRILHRIFFGTMSQPALHSR